jgi:peptidoglycan/LPS O-acetylase OafA/YrhL
MAQKRFLALDALRGLAAFAVMGQHVDGHIRRLLPHGHLAVDFFFVLSGFVLAHAYGEDSSAVGFFRARLTRLYPMYLVGTLLGVIELSLRGTSAVDLATMVGPALLFLPSIPVGAVYLYPLDAPAWSLLSELVANALWFPARRRMQGLFGLAVLIAGAAAILVVYAVLGRVGGGAMWSNILAGFARVGFGFTAGTLLYQIWRRTAVRPRVPGWVGALLLGAVLAAPLPAIFDLLEILLIPAVVYLGACAQPVAGWASLSRWLGDVSYPIYTIHLPIIGIIGVLVVRPLAGAGMQHLALVMLPASFAFVALCATLAERFYERPVRRWLSGLPAVAAAKTVPTAHAGMSPR